MPSRLSISVATVVMLVLLRLNIGWHFFSEGIKHYTDPHWTSEPTLRAAKGPLAPLFHAYVPDFHRFDDLIHASTENDSHAVQSWVDQIQNDWDGHRQQFAQHYALNDVQQAQTTKVLRQYQDKLRGWEADNHDALATHVHEWQRKETTRERPASNVPFQKKRIAEKQSALNAEANGWLAELKGLEADYHNALVAVLDGNQRNLAAMPHQTTSIDLVDDVMTYVILGIGLLLLLGLFTRLACLTGAVFLLSVVLMQPFWVSEALPTYNQFVEMFALLALATTVVGRWGGLDYFLHNLVTGSSRSMKGQTDVSKS
ncbi:MAG: hypothetical protein HY288_17965 [Planctomycetia bacterium]|nr:hypothetical protein [Planctomycetia bacterium]